MRINTGEAVFVSFQFTERGNQKQSSAISSLLWHKWNRGELSSLERRFFCSGLLLAHCLLHVSLSPLGVLVQFQGLHVSLYLIEKDAKVNQ